jgi:hypothetical protein
MTNKLQTSYNNYLRSLNEGILNEKLFDFDDDVDFIIKESGISDFFNDVEAGKKPYYDEIMNDEEIAFLVIKSDELKSEDAIKAHAINPISIFIGFAKGNIGSHYNPKDKYLLASPNRSAFKTYYRKEEELLPKFKQKTLKQDLSLNRLRYALAHELSHWISDSLHNSHIEKIIDRANELNKADYMKLKKHDVNMTYFEIDALVHSIKDMKRNYTQEEWDNMSLEDIMLDYTALYSVDQILKERYGLEVSLIWQKNLIQRMHREGLLGKKMRSFYKELDLDL